MRQCWYHHYIAIVLPRHSPYTAGFSKKITQMVEGGFIAKWIKVLQGILNTNSFLFSLPSVLPKVVTVVMKARKMKS